MAEFFQGPFGCQTVVSPIRAPLQFCRFAPNRFKSMVLVLKYPCLDAGGSARKPASPLPFSVANVLTVFGQHERKIDSPNRRAITCDHGDRLYSPVLFPRSTDEALSFLCIARNPDRCS